MQKRLAFLGELKMLNHSLYLLTAPRQKFEKFLVDGENRTRGKDTVLFLAGKLEVGCLQLQVGGVHPAGGKVINGVGTRGRWRRRRCGRS